MTWRPLLLLCVLGTSSLGLSAPTGQDTSKKSQPDIAQTQVFRATTRLVTVDVIVHDASGQPIYNLKPSDFTLLEAGQPQKIRFFDTHQGITTSHYTPMQLPAQVYTNIPDYDPNAPKNIVLLDLLNTEFLDQSYTRQQMLKFLANLPGGQPMAVLTLTTSVNMVQGFTGSSDKLVEIAKKLQMANSVLLTSRTSAEADSDALEALRMSGAPGASDLADRVAKALAYSEDSRGCERLVRTTAAFEAIASLLSGYPGRKNLMWISGDFPLSIQPNFITDSNNLHASNLDCLQSPYQLPKISALLASARVAVYPIDVRGVETDMAGPSTRFGNLPNEDANLVFSHEFETEQTRSSRVFGNGGAASFFARSGKRDIMNDLAEQTGGKAFYGSNDITGAMRQTMDLASSYYSLSYEPKDTNWNGKYRKIRVKVATPNRAHLWYRRGYYALA